MEAETKSGYKKTELGLIPEDWEVLLTEELIDFQGGSQPPLSTFIPTEKENYIRLIQIRDYKTNKYTTYIPKNLAKRFCSVDDIMIGRYGPPIFQILRGIEGAYNVALMKAVPKNGVDKDFIYYFLKQDKLFEFIEKLSQRSSGQTGVDLNELKKYPFPLPPLPEQNAIATALKDTDDLINSLESLIAKKKLIKQGAMQELLKPKEGWVKKKLGDLVDFYNGKAHENSITDNGDYIVVNSKFISTNGAIFKKSNECLFPLEENDITMVMSDIPNGKALAKCFLIPKYKIYTLNQRICALRSKEVDSIFLYYILNRNDYFLAFDSGSGQTNLRKIEVLNCPISLPNDPIEQKQIGKRIADIDTEIEVLENKLNKISYIKQGMMQQLLTGKIRII